MCDLLWSDQMTVEVGVYLLGELVIPLGRIFLETFNRNGLTLVSRAHQLVMEVCLFFDIDLLFK